MNVDLVIDEPIYGNKRQFKRTDKSILALLVMENHLSIEDRPPIPSFYPDIPIRYQYVGGFMGEEHPGKQIYPYKKGIFPNV